MPLQPGTRLGPYEVVAPVGQGGMGEVYRGRDTRLERTVAVKVLPALLADDVEFQERFNREARSISSLTHPNICTLYDVGEHRLDDGSITRYLVMEFLDGETLAARLERGAVPLDEALKIASDIASALDKAHRHGIVHRDLKPANVMLTKSGAKLLDFGLAKANPASVFSTATTLATMTSPPRGTTPLTSQGTILGTVQYMSPEQVEGEEVGPRSDLFSFGAVLFEMITGRRAFSGRSPASLLGAILKEDPPPIGQLQPTAPPALERLVKACLAKDPDDRLQSAHDVRLQLRWIQEGGSSAGLPAPVTTHRRNRERAAWIAVAVVGALWLATLVPAVRSLRTPEPPPKVVFTVVTPDVLTGDALSLALSPDGRMLAYVAPADSADNRVLWVRSLDGAEPRSLSGTRGAQAPFWSPDGQSIAFAADGRLLAVSVAGGPPRTICDFPYSFQGGTWNADGTILFARGVAGSNSIAKVSASGGDPVAVMQPDAAQDQSSLFFPQFLPDGRHFIYLASTRDLANRMIYVGSLDGGDPVPLVRSAAAASVVPGFLLYVRDESLVAQRFDVDRLAVSGDPVPVAPTVLVGRGFGRSGFSVSRNGVLAFRSSGPGELLSQLAWLDRKGRVIQTVGEPAPYNQIRLSPDERRVAAALPDSVSTQYHIWTIDLASGIATKAIDDDISNDPTWLPGGQTLLFESVRDNKRDFYSQVVGSRTRTLVYESPENPKWLSDVSRDGRFLLYHLPRPSKLVAVPIENGRGSAPITLTHTDASIDNAHFSADGKWVVYQQNDTGRFEVWVASFPAFDNRRRISSRGGGQPFWRSDGQEVFYITSDGAMMSVAVTRDPASPGGLAFRAPVELFKSPVGRPNLTIDQYSVAADGQRFLFIQPRRDDSGAMSPITVVVNWQTGLGR
jgi:Tol biopolymer transport system component